MRVYWQEIVALFVLAIPVACVARTVVFEEVLREPREYCQERSKACRSLLARKFFYLFTCEYCFSHWVTLLFLCITGFHLLFDGWRGSVIAFFSVVFIANAYLNLYSRLRIDLASEKVEIKAKERQIAAIEAGLPAAPNATEQPKSSDDSGRSRMSGGSTAVSVASHAT